MVVGPDWKGETPPGIRKVFRSGTQFSLAGFRTQLFDAADIDNVKKVQAGYKAQPLSTYLKQPAPPAAPAVAFPEDQQGTREAEVLRISRLRAAIRARRSRTRLRSARKLASIGVGPGKTFNFKDLPLEQKLEVAIGMKQGESKVDEAVAKVGTVINGWSVSGLPGDSAHYNGDWLARAVAAQAGIYGN